MIAPESLAPGKLDSVITFIQLSLLKWTRFDRTSISQFHPAMKITCALLVVSAFVLCAIVPEAHSIKVRRGRGLNRCKPFRTGCSLASMDKVPFFIVNDFASGDINCSDYLPSDANDIDVDEPHEAVADVCKSAEPLTNVRICIMKRRYMRDLVLDQNLRLSEIEDLDFSNVSLSDIKFQGKCYSCPDQAEVTIV
eukprot:maker-scaffold499_size154954-snap-gene-0.17 protein:Tk03758 transcript:maker-scaffold499_size154954-snap-gene-0.17-mRNA-1 annotation:"integrase catalytic region"